MIALFAGLIVGKVWIYFAFEMTFLNLLLIYVLFTQEKICRTALKKLKEQGNYA